MKLSQHSLILFATALLSACPAVTPSLESTTKSAPSSQSSIAPKSDQSKINDETVDTSTLTGIHSSLTEGLRLLRGGQATILTYATYSDGLEVDITAETSWRFAGTSLGSVVGGVFNAQTSGISLLIGEFDGQEMAIDVEVLDDRIQSIEISPLKLELGVDAPLRATGTYQDGRQVDITKLVSWSTSDENGLTARLAPPRLYPQHVGAYLINARLGQLKATVARSVSAPDVSGISITLPASGFVPLLGSAQLRAIATFINGSTADYTEFVRWRSNDDDRLVISTSAGSRGRATGKSLGVWGVTASLGGLVGAADVEVSYGCVDLKVLNTTSVVAYATIDLPLSVQCLYQDGSSTDEASVAQLSLDTTAVPPEAKIITVNGLPVLKPAFATASAILGTVTVGAVTKTFSLTIFDKPLTSIALQEPAAINICDNQVQHAYVAIGTFGQGADAEIRDITGDVTWTTSAPTTATIDGLGRLTTLAPGNIEVTASALAIDGTAISRTVAVTIGPTEPRSLTLSAFAYNSQAAKKRGSPLVGPLTIPKGSKVSLAAFFHKSCGAAIDVTGLSSTQCTSPGGAGLTVIKQSGSCIVSATAHSQTRQISVTHTPEAAAPINASVDVALTPHEVTHVEVRSSVQQSIPGSTTPFGVVRGEYVDLTAWAIYTDAYEQNITSALNASDDDPSSVSQLNLTTIWSSTVPIVADFVLPGRAQGLSEGSTSVSIQVTVDYIDAARANDTMTATLVHLNQPQTLEVRSPCNASGRRYGAFCYALADLGESCATYCTTEPLLSGLQQAATNDAICAAIINQLTFGSYTVSQAIRPTGGLGCALAPPALRELAPLDASSYSASSPDVRRVCACADDQPF